MTFDVRFSDRRWREPATDVGFRARHDARAAYATKASTVTRRGSADVEPGESRTSPGRRRDARRGRPALFGAADVTRWDRTRIGSVPKTGRSGPSGPTGFGRRSSHLAVQLRGSTRRGSRGPRHHRRRVSARRRGCPVTVAARGSPRATQCRAASTGVTPARWSSEAELGLVPGSRSGHGTCGRAPEVATSGADDRRRTPLDGGPM